MTQSAVVESIQSPGSRVSLPIAGQSPVDDIDIDAELKAFESEERARLGLEKKEQWIEEMADLTFTQKERPEITMLIGGLTLAHDYIVSGGLRNSGYNVVALDAPDYDSLRVGKEFGNRAQCNPTYFTVGNLVKFLIHLRDKKGMSTEEIIAKHVFLTAGACGPCRFGMYTTEYRKALRDAGFDGFRVMLFQQHGGLSQATGEESGLEMNPKFFINMVKGLIAGDIVNGLGYRIRPYELRKGATDETIDLAKRICYEALLNGKSILRALSRCKRLFAEIEVDRTQAKPRVAIIGEFWAMTTEGDGNYRLQRFIEQEGAEADIQFVTSWLLYNIWEVGFDTSERTQLGQHDDANLSLNEMGEFGVFTRKVTLWAADKVLRAAFHSFAYSGGFYEYHLPKMKEIADIAAPYYNNNMHAGEGHMEVGKLILNIIKNKASMTLSVKPFGCMPSASVSDGVQSLITERYPKGIYCAVETNGDGAVNFQSRIQMYLFKARKAAEKELAETLEKAGVTMDEVQSFIKKNPRFGGALHRAPHSGASTPSDLVSEIADHIQHSPSERFARNANKRFSSAFRWTKSAILGAPARAPQALEGGRELAQELGELARSHGPALVKKGVDQAMATIAKLPVGAQVSSFLSKAS